MKARPCNRPTIGLFLAVALSACHRPPPTPPTGILVLSVAPQRSTVLVDDRPLLLPTNGQQPTRVRVSVGPHRIEVRALGHLTRYFDVAIQAGTDSVLLAALHPDPEAEADSTAAATPAFAPRARELPTLP